MFPGVDSFSSILGPVAKADTPAYTVPVGKRLTIYALLCLAMAIGFTLVKAATDVDEVWLTDENGPMQWTQAGVLVVALVLLLIPLFSQGLKVPEAGIGVGLAFLALFLAWREIEIDGRLWGVHAFSFKYLWGGDEHEGQPIPWAVRLGLGVPTLSLCVATAAVLVIKFDFAWASVTKRWPRALFWLLVVAFGLLAISQGWDKAGTLAKNLGITVFEHEARDPIAEEILELAGEMLVMFFAWEYVQWRRTQPSRQLMTDKERKRTPS